MHDINVNKCRLFKLKLFVKLNNYNAASNVDMWPYPEGKVSIDYHLRTETIWLHVTFGGVSYDLSRISFNLITLCRAHGYYIINNNVGLLLQLIHTKCKDKIIVRLYFFDIENRRKLTVRSMNYLRKMKKCSNSNRAIPTKYKVYILFTSHFSGERDIPSTKHDCWSSCVY